MQYPAPVMSITELEKMHFPVQFLRNAANSDMNKKWKFAWKSGDGKNSKWLFDTEEFEKLRKRGYLSKCQPQVRGKKMG